MRRAGRAEGSKAVTRAGGAASVTELAQDILKMWDRQVAMSRASLEQQVRILSGLKGEKLGQEGVTNGVRA
jgi:hypothetical protein